jgi:signal transduction histidine kinase
VESYRWMLIQDVKDALIDQSEMRQQKLEIVGLDQSYPSILVDPMRIREVITNLIANAIHYTPMNGTISVAIEKKYEDDGEYIQFSVSDTGPGIPDEAIPHLFTKFYRVHGTLEMGSKGTGLGLFISKSIIDMHKGKIWVKSEVGKGSTFFFKLPVAHDDELAQHNNELPKESLLNERHGIILNPKRNKKL